MPYLVRFPWSHAGKPESGNVWIRVKFVGFPPNILKPPRVVPMTDFFFKFQTHPKTIHRMLKNQATFKQTARDARARLQARRKQRSSVLSLLVELFAM